MSSECDISRGLCCQLQRRHRQAPRKVINLHLFFVRKKKANLSCHRKF